MRPSACGPPIVMMEPTEHRDGNDVPLGRALRSDGDQLVDPLVRARGVVVPDVFGDDAVEVPAVEHENVVEALATQRAQKAFADGVHVRRAHRGLDYPDPGGSRRRVRKCAVKSAAAMGPQCPLRKVFQGIVLPRIGAGSMPCSVRMRWRVDGPRSKPRFSSASRSRV